MRFELDAGFRIDQHLLRHGLREGQIDRLALAKPEIEVVGPAAFLVNTGFHALLATNAKFFQDVARLMPYLHFDSSQRMPGLLATWRNWRRIVRAARSALDLVDLADRPAPESHRRIALEIPDHAVLAADPAGDDPQGLVDAVPDGLEVIAPFFGQAARGPEVAKEDGDFGLPGPEDFLDVLLMEGGKDLAGE